MAELIQSFHKRELGKQYGKVVDRYRLKFLDLSAIFPGRERIVPAQRVSSYEEKFLPEHAHESRDRPDSEETLVIDYIQGAYRMAPPGVNVNHHLGHFSPPSEDHWPASLDGAPGMQRFLFLDK